MERIETFFKKLKLATTDTKIKELCELECSQMTKEYTLSSRKSRYSKYRNYFKQSYLDSKSSKMLLRVNEVIKTINSKDPVDEAILKVATECNFSCPELKKKYKFFTHVLSFFKLTKFESNYLTDKYTEKVRALRLSRKYILDVDGYIEKALSLVYSDAFAVRVLALAALTGRRVAEIGCTANFEYVDANHVSFTGQLKTRSEEKCPAFIIPVLCDAKIIVDSQKDLHLKFPKYLNDPRSFNNNCASYMSKKVKVYEPFIDDTISAKDLRAIYAAIACERYSLDELKDSTIFYSEILGHDKDNADTFLSYRKYLIKNNI
jgi:hypothetical protein